MFRRLGLWWARGLLFRPWPSLQVQRVWPQALELARVLAQGLVWRVRQRLVRELELARVLALVWRVRPRRARALEPARVLAQALVWRVRPRLARALVWLLRARA